MRHKQLCNPLGICLAAALVPEAVPGEDIQSVTSFHLLLKKTQLCKNLFRFLGIKFADSTYFAGFFTFFQRLT